MKTVILTALLSLSVGLAHAGERAEAPMLKAKSLKDNLIDLSQYKGKIVLIAFWATWCSPCKKAIPDFIKLQKEIGTDKIEILAINMDDAQTRARVKSVIKRHKWKIPVILDADGTITKKLNSSGSAPFTVVIDKQGKIAHSEEGYTSDNAEKWSVRLKALSVEP